MWKPCALLHWCVARTCGDIVCALCVTRDDDPLVDTCCINSTLQVMCAHMLKLHVIVCCLHACTHSHKFWLFAVPFQFSDAPAESPSGLFKAPSDAALDACARGEVRVFYSGAQAKRSRAGTRNAKRKHVRRGSKPAGSSTPGPATFVDAVDDLHDDDHARAAGTKSVHCKCFHFVIGVE